MTWAARGRPGTRTAALVDELAYTFDGIFTRSVITPEVDAHI